MWRTGINQYLKTALVLKLHNIIIKNKWHEKCYSFLMVHISPMVATHTSGPFQILQYLYKNSELIPEINSFQMTSGVYPAVTSLANSRYWNCCSDYEFPSFCRYHPFLGGNLSLLSNFLQSTIQQNLKDWYYFLSIGLWHSSYTSIWYSLYAKRGAR